ncbi:hypothetical protein UFOVP1454_10 [uncultured Caudovirales phage]|uniref:DUF5675 domain-containing protein n=1 Tax=uncultured Caudovirales phage TaxID=2100421 RepID=A0A6J5SI36_9CAUD|nr:hypothetical protein UFOVP1454_10 [uncultured Caudovirales phage]
MNTLELRRDLVLNEEAGFKVTFGKLYLPWIENHPDIYTIELPKGDGGHGYCITQGLYNIQPHNTAAHPNTYELLRVPRRTSILIHSGNFASDVKLQGSSHSSDTEGCILVGFGIEPKIPMITKSKSAMDWLRETLGKNNYAIEVRE